MRTRVIPERFWGDNSRRGALLSARAFILMVFIASQYMTHDVDISLSLFDAGICVATIEHIVKLFHHLVRPSFWFSELQNSKGGITPQREP